MAGSAGLVGESGEVMVKVGVCWRWCGLVVVVDEY
jgi:hypothetical protein